MDRCRLDPPPSSANAGPRTPPRTYYGKYRGKVLDNEDPLMLGRVLAEVPAMPGALLSWALPATPYAGPEVGLFLIPPIGANVWVEYEGGDPSHPIWSGCFWEEGEMPIEPAIPLKKVLRTSFIELELDDTPEEGGFTLRVLPPLAPDVLSITGNEAGIAIQCPPNSIRLTPELIEVASPPATATFAEETITIEVPATTIEITGEAIEIETAELSVTANCTVEGAVEITGDVEIAGAVEIEGNVEITGAVEIEGNVEIAGAVEVEGNVEIVGAVEVQGNVNVLGALEVEGDVNILGAQQTEGNCAVLGVIEGVVVPPLL